MSIRLLAVIALEADVDAAIWVCAVLKLFEVRKV